MFFYQTPTLGTKLSNVILHETLINFFSTEKNYFLSKNNEKKKWQKNHLKTDFINDCLSCSLTSPVGKLGIDKIFNQVANSAGYFAFKLINISANTSIWVLGVMPPNRHKNFSFKIFIQKNMEKIFFYQCT